MQSWAAAALVAILAGGVGCQRTRTTVNADLGRTSAQFSHSAAQAPEADSRIQMQTRLIERPAGDEFLTKDLWKETIDPLPHELSARLAANGLRVGVVCGQLPVELERLATSEAVAVQAMMRAFLAGRPKAVPVNGPVARCTAAVRTDLGGESIPKEWEFADCGVIVTAMPRPDGQLQLRVEFQIQHGERTFAYQPNSDGTAFDGRHQRTVEGFPTLEFEVTLRRGDLLLFGSTEAPAGTLGQAFFYPLEADRMRQRVLMIQPFQVSSSGPVSRSAKVTLAAHAAR